MPRPTSREASLRSRSIPLSSCSDIAIMTMSSANRRLEMYFPIHIYATVRPLQSSVLNTYIFQCVGEQFWRYDIPLSHATLQLDRFRLLILDISSTRCIANRYGNAAGSPEQLRFRWIRTIRRHSHSPRRRGTAGDYYTLRSSVLSASLCVCGLWYCSLFETQPAPGAGTHRIFGRDDL